MWGRSCGDRFELHGGLGFYLTDFVEGLNSEYIQQKWT